METVTDLVVLVRLESGAVHQVSLNEAKTTLVSGFIKSLFTGAVPIEKEVLSVTIERICSQEKETKQ